MSINSLYGNTGTTLRFGGMASGLDTDSIIKNLMQIEQLKVDRLYQNKTKTEWLREDYRGINKILKDFKDTRFDVLNSSTYMLSSSAYRTYKVTSTSDEYVDVSPRSGTIAGTTTIEAIENLATSASLTSSSDVSAPLRGTVDLNVGMLLNGKSIIVSLDGVSKTITFSKDYVASDSVSFINDLQLMLNDTFGTGRVQATATAIVGQLDLEAVNSQLSIIGGTALETLGLTTGQSNRINLDESIANVKLKVPISFGTGGMVAFDINGVSFNFSSTTTLRQMMSDINNSEAGVRLTYNSITDSFKLTANTTGAGNTIVIANKEGSFFGDSSSIGIISIGITELVANDGKDAKLSINGSVIYRSSNNFIIDGISFALKATYNSTYSSTEAIKINAEYDVSTAVEKIKGFVSQYNEIIETINGKLTEERFRGFLPLTEVQKGEMSDKEAEMWEGKARSGSLKGDRILEGIVGEMRKALIDTVEGAGLSLSSIGIKTGNYMEKGKLLLDENKLTDALQNQGDKVEKLFAAQSEISYSPSLTSTQRSQRYQESGLMHRVSDILNDYIRTTRDNDGRKGILLEKAGITGDITEYQNTLNDEISRIDRSMDAAIRLMQSKEDTYWKQFTAMEKAIQQMNSQSSWLTQQTGNASS